MKTKITIDDLMGWIECSNWTRDRVQKLFGKRKYVTPMQIAKVKDVKSEDKLWILLRPEIIEEKSLHLLACDIAEDVLPIFEKAYPDDKRPRKAIDAKRLWVQGKITDVELAAARVAAGAATCWAAAWAAACWAAAGAVARDAT